MTLSCYDMFCINFAKVVNFCFCHYNYCASESVTEIFISKINYILDFITILLSFAILFIKELLVICRSQV